MNGSLSLSPWQVQKFKPVLAGYYQPTQKFILHEFWVTGFIDNHLTLLNSPQKI
jgi:hypothetical protein